MSTAEEKFKTFDFATDVAWKTHLDQLFPTPTGDKLEKIKRRWFKKNVDSTLEVEQPHVSFEQSTDTTNTSTSTTDTGSQERSQSSSSQQSSSASASSSGSGFIGKIVNTIGTPVGKLFDMIYAFALPMKDKFYFMEGVLKFVFIICAILLPQFANMIAFNVCLLGFLRQTGRPRWDITYGKRALENEFLQNILYMVPFAFFPNQKTLVYYLPLGIHFWIGFCEFVNLKLPTIYPKIAKFADFTRQNRGILMQQKAKLEIMLFVFIFILLFFGGSNLILIFFYGNFLKTKYLLNSSTKSAFYEINTWVEGKLNHPYCPGIAKFIVDKVRSLCAYLVKV